MCGVPNPLHLTHFINTHKPLESMWHFIFDFVSPRLAQCLELGRRSVNVGWMNEWIFIDVVSLTLAVLSSLKSKNYTSGVYFLWEMVKTYEEGNRKGERQLNQPFHLGGKIIDSNTQKHCVKFSFWYLPRMKRIVGFSWRVQC